MNCKYSFFFLFLFFPLISISLTQSQTKSTQKIPSPNIIVIPFKTFYTKTNNNNNKKTKFSSLDYYNQIQTSKLYLKMESKNNQYLHVFLSTDETDFYLDDYFAELGSINCPYSSQLSPTYHYCDKYTAIGEDYNIDRFIYAKDDFKLFKDYLLNKYDLISIEFQHYKDKDKNITYSCGKTGLKLPSYNTNKKGNFISQIHNKAKNVDISFSFKYTNNENARNINDLNEGLFIIGIQSYEKDKNVEMDSIYVSQLTYGTKVGWKFDIYNIFIGNKYFDFDDLEIEINPEIDGFQITPEFFQKLNEYFFQDYYSKGICENEMIKYDRYIVIYCYADKFLKKDIDNFPELIFYKNQINYNFTFTGNELFQQIEDKLYFKMITNLEIYNKDIIFGKLFLKKYQVIFNSDYKSISFYRNNNNNIFGQNNKGNNNIALETNKKGNILISILFVIFGIIIFVSGIFLGKKFCNIKRRIYANELEDNNYVYESKNNKQENSKEHILIEV